jgi:hypothetical protein
LGAPETTRDDANRRGCRARNEEDDPVATREVDVANVIFVSTEIDDEFERRVVRAASK